MAAKGTINYHSRGWDRESPIVRLQKRIGNGFGDGRALRHRRPVSPLQKLARHVREDPVQTSHPFLSKFPRESRLWRTLRLQKRFALRSLNRDVDACRRVPGTLGAVGYH
jgi:hypothetical protein